MALGFTISIPRTEFTLTTPSASFSVKENAVIMPPAYTGAYEVDPDFTGTVLETEGKMMTDDVTVNAIEVARVTNPSGGKTVYIGGIING